MRLAPEVKKLLRTWIQFPRREEFMIHFSAGRFA
jgi:hypothetical protein